MMMATVGPTMRGRVVWASTQRRKLLHCRQQLVVGMNKHSRLSCFQRCLVAISMLGRERDRNDFQLRVADLTAVSIVAGFHIRCCARSQNDAHVFWMVLAIQELWSLHVGIICLVAGEDLVTLA